MKKYILLFALALSVSASFAAYRATGAPLTGYIDDAMCAAKGSCSSTDRVSCAQKCIKGGSPAVLVVGDKVYKIANQKAVLKYAGKKVTIDGKVAGETITVTKVTEVKA